MPSEIESLRLVRSHSQAIVDGTAALRSHARAVLEITEPYLVGGGGPVEPDPGPVEPPSPGPAADIGAGLDPNPLGIADFNPDQFERIVRGKRITGTHKPEVPTIYEDCIFDGKGAAYALDLRFKTGSVFLGCDVSNANKGILGSDFEFYNGHIHDCFSDGVNVEGNNVVLQNTKLERFGSDLSAHADGFQGFAGGAWRIDCNHFLVPGDRSHVSNACILLKSGTGVISGVGIQGNIFDGGLRNIQVRQGSSRQHPIPTNISVKGNAFARYVFSPVDWEGQPEKLAILRGMNSFSKSRKMVLPSAA